MRGGRSIAIGIVVWVLVLAAAGCGGDNRVMTVVGTEMAFDAPERVPAAAYVVTFRNDGAVAHELAFKNPAGEIVVRRSIGGKQRITMKVTLEPGTWELGCFEPGHYEAGMHRKLVVEDG